MANQFYNRDIDEDYDLPSEESQNQWTPAPLYEGPTPPSSRSRTPSSPPWAPSAIVTYRPRERPDRVMTTPPGGARGAESQLDWKLRQMMAGEIPPYKLNEADIYFFVNMYRASGVRRNRIADIFDAIQPPSLFNSQSEYDLNRTMFVNALDGVPPPPPYVGPGLPSLFPEEIADHYAFYGVNPPSPPVNRWFRGIGRYYVGRGGFMSALGSALQKPVNAVGSALRKITPMPRR